MTKEQFDNYSFSMYTEVNYLNDFWDRITEVDFEKRYVGIQRGQIVSYEEIKGIKN